MTSHTQGTALHLVLTALLLAASTGTAQTAPYLDSTLSPERRVQDLLPRMTLEEKVGQLTQISVLRLMGRSEWERGPLNEDWMDRILAQQHVGSLLSGGGAAPVPNTPEGWARMTNDLQRYALENSRLKIPLLYGVDAVHGHNNVVDATMFPHNLNLAATFDRDTTRLIAEVTARALRATGIHWNFAPAADIGADPRWGRFYETWGDSPLVASEMVAQSVRGLQGAGPGPSTVAATVKHFVGYGAPQGGKDRANAVIPDGDLQAVHLAPIRAGLSAGAATVMVNSGAVNGVPVHASRELLTGVLRDQLGFRGVAISDWEDIKRLQTVHNHAPTYREAVKAALLAGVDVSMVPHDAEGFTSAVLDLVRSGEVPEARIDEAARRVLHLKFRLGLFEKPYVDPSGAEVAVTAGRDLALRAARQSMVLLENRGVLPLGRTVKNVLVVGEHARDPRAQLGGWTVGWQGLPDNEDTRAVTVLDGMKQVVPRESQLAFSAAVPDRPAQDALVVVVGEPPRAEGEADNPGLALPAADVELLRAAVRTGKPVVAVLLTGRPVLLPADVQRGLSALLFAGLPGSEGGRAVADVLYGNTSPSGRLPFTWPASLAQVPARTSGEPLYPFGYGLSYTSFRYDDVRVAGDTVRLNVTNTGSVPGTHTVLAFTPAGQGARERLVAFGRVTLQPEETRELTLLVAPGSVIDGQEVRVGNTRVRAAAP